MLVTGDNPRAARHIARQVGIREVRAEVLPDGRAELVREIQADGVKVAMVGDGINDAPALIQADVGIALGNGADITTEAADIIIVRDDVSLIRTARGISRGSCRRVKQNVALAFTFNGIGIPLATTGLVHSVWAMVAMAPPASPPSSSTPSADAPACSSPPSPVSAAPKPLYTPPRPETRSGRGASQCLPHLVM